MTSQTIETLPEVAALIPMQREPLHKLGELSLVECNPLAEVRRLKEPSIGPEETRFIMECGSLTSQIAAQKKLHDSVKQLRALRTGIPITPEPRKLAKSIAGLEFQLERLVTLHFSPSVAPVPGSEVNAIFQDRNLDVEKRPTARLRLLKEQDNKDADRLDAPAGDVDIVGLYMKRVGDVRLLTADEEVLLAQQIEAGVLAREALRDGSTLKDMYEKMHRGSGVPAFAQELEYLGAIGDRSKDYMVRANLRLVVSLAARYQGRGLDLIDLVQEGNIGLNRAVEKFDYTKGYKFSTYATWWIRQALQRSLADQGRNIRIPVHAYENVNKVSRIQRSLIQILGREPTLEEVAAESGLTPARAKEALDMRRDTLSLQSPIGDDGAELGDFIQDDGVDLSQQVVEQKEMLSKLEGLIATLSPRDAEVISLTFGLSDGKSQSLKEVGKRFGLTPETIRQIQRKALEKMRQNPKSESLKGYAS